MNKLFDKKDVLTVVTVDQAVPYTKGHFGNTLGELKGNIKRKKLNYLDVVVPETALCFCDDEGKQYALFLPENKVTKRKKFRAIKSIDELCELMFGDIIDPSSLLGIPIKQKCGNKPIYKQLISLCEDDDTGNLFINYEKSENFVNTGYILKNGEWVRLAIEDEE